MADDTVKELVSKWTLDTSGWSDEVKAARATLQEAADQDKTTAQAAKASSDTIIAGLKVQQEQQRLIIEQKKAEIASDNAKVAADRAAAAEGLKATKEKVDATQVAANAERVAQEKLGSEITAIINRTMAGNRAAAAEKQKLINEERIAQEKLGSEILAIMHRTDVEAKKVYTDRMNEERKLAAEAAERTEHSPLNLLRGPIQTVAGGKGSILGNAAGGLMGALTGGAEVGAAVVGFEALESVIDKTVEKIKEFIEDSGGLQKVLYTFQQLSAGKGYDSGAFLDQLKDKTQNLVAEVDLLREANTFMQSGLKITKDQMLTLTEATVQLARTQGKDATDAVQALTRMFLTGGRGAMQLSRIVGIQTPMLMERGFATTTSLAEKQQMIMNHLYDVIVKRWQQMGEVPLTYTDRLKQVQVVSNELYEQIAQGAVKSSGFTAIMSGFGKMVEQLGGLEDAATKVGEAIGNAFTPMAAIFIDLIPTLTSVVRAIDAIGSSVGTLASIVVSAAPGDHLISSFERLHPVLALTIKYIDSLSNYIQGMAAKVILIAEVTQKAMGEGQTPTIDSPEFKQWQKERGRSTSLGQGTPVQDYQQYRKEYQASNPTKTFAQIMDEYNSSAGTRLPWSGAPGKESAESQVAGIIDTYGRHQAGADSENLRSSGGLPIQASDKAKVTSWEDKVIADIQSKQKETDTKIAKITQDNQDHKISDKDADKQIEEIRRTTTQQVIADKKKSASALGLMYKEPPPVAPTTTFDEQALNRRHDFEKAQADLAKKKADAQAALEVVKSTVAEETEVNDQMYKTGKESAADYYNKKKEYANQTLAATLSDIRKESEADKALIDEKVKNGTMFKDVGVTEKSKIDQTAHTKEVAVLTANAKSLNDADLDSAEDADRAKTALIDEQVQHQKDAAAQIVAVIKWQYSEGLVSSKEYFDASLAEIMGNVKAVENAETQKRTLITNSATDIVNSYKKEEAAIDAAKKAVDALNDSFAAQALQNTQSRFGNISGALSSRQSIVQATGGPQSVQQNFDIVGQQKQVVEAQIQSLEQLLSQATEYSTTWYQIYEAILKATQQSQALNLQIQELSSSLPGIGNAFQEMSKLGGQLFGSKYARGLEASVSAGGSMIANVQKNHNAIFGVKQQADPQLKAIEDATDAASKTVIDSAKNSSSGLDTFSTALKSAQQVLIEALTSLAAKMQQVAGGGSGAPAISGVGTPIPGGGESPSILSSSPAVETAAAQAGVPVDTSMHEQGHDGGLASAAAPAATGLQKFTKEISSSIEAVSGFVSTITNAQSASAGAVGGGMGGAGLGASLTSGMSGMMGMLGPLAGLLGGASLGAIFGNKQEEVQQDITQLNVSYKQIMDSYSTNNQSLQQTVTMLQNLIAQAQQMQSQTKKGGQQYAQLILQYNQEITQLQDTAETTMTQLQQQLQVLAEPTPYQSIVQSVQSIVQQYAQFAGAASNATQLAQANQFLTESLQQLGVSYTQQLQQDETQAIQSALSLNELYNQRNQLNQQYLLQVRSIMGQGTITRGVTQAQSKFSQLYDADVNQQNALDQINQQINLAQYQVAAEQQIFNLATTKAGLETQLLQLQEVGVNNDMARIAAMQDLLNTMASTGYSITNLSSVNTSDPNSLITQLMQLLLSGLGTGSFGAVASASPTSAVGGGTLPGSIAKPHSLDESAATAYATRASYGYAAYRSQNI